MQSNKSNRLKIDKFDTDNRKKDGTNTGVVSSNNVAPDSTKNKKAINPNDKTVKTEKTAENGQGQKLDT